MSTPERQRKPIESILFVCTGNVFRSLTAEHALRARLRAGSPCRINSAGTEAKPQSVHEWVSTRLKLKGADVSGHVQRQLTRDMVESADLVIAMGEDHRRFLREQFGKEAPLFNHICLGHESPILDVHEVIPGWESEPERARHYVWTVIDAIWAAAPALLSRLK